MAEQRETIQSHSQGKPFRGRLVEGNQSGAEPRKTRQRQNKEKLEMEPREARQRQGKGKQIRGRLWEARQREGKRKPCRG